MNTHAAILSAVLTFAMLSGMLCSHYRVDTAKLRINHAMARIERLEHRLAVLSQIPDVIETLDSD